MNQLYFLSILCNGLGGYILFTADEDQAVEKHSLLSLKNPVFHLILGILSIIIGVLKLLWPFESSFYILGDFVPAAAGIINGFLLIFGIYRKETSLSSIEETKGTMEHLGENLLVFRKSLGLALLVVALVHFLFPKALFL
jgi:uncharacterized membrane protein HdeD (DUF308 family)